MMKVTAPENRWISIILVLTVFLPCFRVNAQDAPATESPSGAMFTFGTDLVSRYIWRGADYGNAPALQPTVAFSAGGFKAGFWGSYGLSPYSQRINDTVVENMGHYAECDLFLSYTVKGFTLSFTDYFIPNGLNPNSDNQYFNYDNSSTGHSFEAGLSWAGPTSFPLQLSANTVFYGADKDKDSSGVYGMGIHNNYSTYLEASYTFDVKGFDVKPVIGAIPFGSSWYGKDAGIVNAGLTLSKSIALSLLLSLPLYGSVITKPLSQSIYLVFGLSLQVTR